MGLCGLQSLPLSDEIKERKSLQSQIPLLVVCGTDDVVLPAEKAYVTFQYLTDEVYKSNPSNITIETMTGLKHAITPDNLSRASKWIFNIIENA